MTPSLFVQRFNIPQNSFRVLVKHQCGGKNFFDKII